ADTNEVHGNSDVRFRTAPHALALVYARIRGPHTECHMTGKSRNTSTTPESETFNRRNILLGGTALAATLAVAGGEAAVQSAQAQQQPRSTAPAGSKPNILVIFGDDIGQTNLSCYSFGVMGFKTPNIDRLAREGMMFTDYYAENSCTAGRSTFITGQ